MSKNNKIPIKCQNCGTKIDTSRDQDAPAWADEMRCNICPKCSSEEKMYHHYKEWYMRKTAVTPKQRRLYKIHWQLKRRGYKIKARQRTVLVSQTEPPEDDSYTSKWLTELIAANYSIQYTI